jgi:hypothetical protein
MPPFPSDARRAGVQQTLESLSTRRRRTPWERGRARSQERPETPTARGYQASVFSNQGTF